MKNHTKQQMAQNELNNEMPKNYDPHTIEEKWFKFWIDNKLFESHTNHNDREPYTILMPPPNCTGALHLGHAINDTFQDILIRYKKLQGYDVKWVVGTDHGGLGTEQMVKKALAKEGLTKELIGREKYNDYIWKWKEEKCSTITSQIKRLGCACSWENEQFTLSPKLSSWVNKVFKTLYEKGLIYRSNYLTNYCCSCGTALSNVEIDHVEKSGKIYHIKYFLSDSVNNQSDYIVVATTRPETLFGDVAIAVNPSDERYTHLIGKYVAVPLVNRQIPIIADNYVKQDFGTGMVKITPSHDKDDYDVGKRHNLVFNINSQNNNLEGMNVIGLDGKICNTQTEFDGINAKSARGLVIEKLISMNQLICEKPHTNTVGHCYRCKNEIETLLSLQWFVKTETLRQQAIDYVTKDQIKFTPVENKEHILRWLSNDIDWCISRSIWWGHQIPIWYCKACKHVNCSDEIIDACEKCKSSDIQRDSDVLDTWFSSALWGFSVFDNEEDLNRYFPTNVLITGSDILFFWVARMIMMTSEIKKSTPFKDVFLHGIVRDINKNKMSKTLGNGIDPMNVIEEYSADILRFTMMHYTHVGSDINIGKESFEIGKTFCTKLWNSVRYIKGVINTSSLEIGKGVITKSTIDEWIFHKLNDTISSVNMCLDTYDIGEAARKLYNFVWNDFCSCYLEAAKATINDDSTKNTILNVMKSILILLHPFIPHITEELNSLLFVNSDCLFLSSWPSIDTNIKKYNDNSFETYKEINNKIRNVKSNFNIGKNDIIDVHISSDDNTLVDFIKGTDVYIKKLCGVGNILYNCEPQTKFITHELNNLKLCFPINDKYKIESVIDNIKIRQDALRKKIDDINKTINDQSKTLGKKKVQKFLNNIIENEKEIQTLDDKINCLLSFL